MIGILIIFFSLTQPQTIVYSAVLPGSADLINGQKVKGAIHLAAEGIIWGSAVWYNWDAGKIKQSYCAYAYIKAGASPKREDEEYLNAVERYGTAKEYNDYIENTARDLYGDNITERDAYIQKHSIPSDEVWEWKDDSTFNEYINLRKSERFSRHMVVNAFGLAVFNRIVAVFSNAVIKKKNVDMGVAPMNDGYRFVVNWRF